MKTKQIKIIIGVLIMTILIIGVSSFTSYAKFGVINPISTAYGLIKVMFTDTEYVEIQQYPRVIVAKPDTSLDKYMEKHGYTRDTEKQLGALCTFTAGDFKELIVYSQNKYISKWRWRE